MKIVKKLKALFFKDDHPVSLELAAAEIKEGRAYLHPKEDRTITYLIKSDDIEVRLSKGKSLTDRDILVIGKRKKLKKIPKKPRRILPSRKQIRNPQQRPKILLIPVMWFMI